MPVELARSQYSATDRRLRRPPGGLGVAGFPLAGPRPRCVAGEKVIALPTGSAFRARQTDRGPRIARYEPQRKDPSAPIASPDASRESERRSELLSFLSHDLRIPLVSLISITQLAALQPERLADAGLIGRIEGHARRALELADDLLRLARADSAEQLNIQLVDLQAVADRALEQVEAQAEAKRIQIRRCSDLADSTVQGDEDLLERSLVNLLSNAIKYSPEGASVTLWLETSQEHVKCSVDDTGFGISEENLPRIFECFQRLQRSEHLGEKGVGIGLALVKSVVDRHRGRIEVSSELNKGSCFSLYLPRRQPAE